MISRGAGEDEGLSRNEMREDGIEYIYMYRERERKGEEETSGYALKREPTQEAH